MAEQTLWTIGIVMGVLVIAVAVASGRLTSWRHYTPVGESSDSRLRWLSSPSTWVGAVLVLAAVGSALVIVVTSLQETVSDFEFLGGMAGLALAALLALPGSYLLWGVYDLARKRGLGNAHAIGVTTGVGGLLVVGVIALQLLA